MEKGGVLESWGGEGQGVVVEGERGWSTVDWIRGE